MRSSHWHSTHESARPSTAAYPAGMATLGSSGIDVSRLCLGANVFGWTADRDTSFAVLDAFLDAGGNFVDTSDSYMWRVPGNSGGESETIIGEWFTDRGRRDEVVLATKVSSLPARKGLAAANIAAACDDSLRRLRTDRIDLYYAHYDDPSVAQEEYLDAFDALQPHYNLMERADFETSLQPLLAAEGLSCLPYYGLAKGFLTGKYRDGGPVVDSPRAEGALAYLDDRGRAVLAVLDEIAAGHEVSVASVALAWLAARPTVAAPIASARTVEQLTGLLPALDLKLTDDEVRLLSHVSA